MFKFIRNIKINKVLLSISLILDIENELRLK